MPAKHLVFIYFKKIMLTINFGFFGLPVRIQIFFVPPCETRLGIFYVSNRRMGWVFQFGFGLDFGFRILCPCLVFSLTRRGPLGLNDIGLEERQLDYKKKGGGNEKGIQKLDTQT